ncbi:hypothetical protein B0T19DRAFT_155871 [Cercophora scortea]|uniref:Uncharacterized protein n=1 Tax=Cercophora scortea TaxID=314031 RepID=A0AAE0ILL0_9PEZI|nr:hypothetical protein B0T19DRAFT_155871 [Cercophora scortea]
MRVVTGKADGTAIAAIAAVVFLFLSSCKMARKERGGSVSKFGSRRRVLWRAVQRWMCWCRYRYQTDGQSSSLLGCSPTWDTLPAGPHLSNPLSVDGASQKEGHQHGDGVWNSEAEKKRKQSNKQHGRATECGGTAQRRS